MASVIEKIVHGLLKEELWKERQLIESAIADRLAVNAFSEAYGNAVNSTSFEPLHFISYSYPTAYWRGWGVNLGDYVQTLATEGALRAVLGSDLVFQTVRRDQLVRHVGGRCVMQGWYENGSLGFLPGPHTDAIWVGTHFCDAIKPRLAKLWQENTATIPWEIGCRDMSTLEFCRLQGVRAYFSRCLTLTFPRRDQATVGEKVFCVDCPDWLIKALPASIAENAERIQQRMFVPKPWDNPKALAESVLCRYRNEAKLVVTTALHCAQPCVAMGIPVVLVDAGCGGADRFSALKGILRVYTRTDIERGDVDFNPRPVDVEPLKKLILRNLQLSLLPKLTCDEEREREQVRLQLVSFAVANSEA